MSIRYEKGRTTEADDLIIRFRSIEQNGLLISTRHDRSQDKLEVTLEAGRVRVDVDIGQETSNLYAGTSLNDDMYHTIIIKRRGNKLNVVVDEDEPIISTVLSNQAEMGYSKLYFGGIEPGEIITSEAPGLIGSMQQLYFNGQNIFEQVRTGQLELRVRQANSARLVESNNEEAVHHAVSFAAANTFIGLPQMKAYNNINLRFMFKTFEPNGLIIYNAGRAMDFIAVELINGSLLYTLNLGYGRIQVRDNTGMSLSDNKWHQVVIGRPSRYKHTMMVDGHIAETTTRGDNYHLDLDGIMYLGIYRTLPAATIRIFYFGHFVFKSAFFRIPVRR